MSNPIQRFECVQELAGTWSVIDHQSDKPAKLDGRLLIGRVRTDAEAARLILEKIYCKGLEHNSKRHWG